MQSRLIVLVSVALIGIGATTMALKIGPPAGGSSSSRESRMSGGLQHVLASMRARASGPSLSVRVSGNQLVGPAGSQIRLLGVDRSGTEYACVQGWGIFDGPSDPASIAAMDSWHINAVRIPLNEDCWLGINGVSPSFSGATYQAAIESYVSELNASGMIAILDLHWNAPGSLLATGQQPMADADHSIAFWASVARAFRSYHAVVFDLYNEPHDISWSCWLNGCVTSGGWRAAGMQQLIYAVREAGGTQPLMVAGLNWAGDLAGWLSHEPIDPLHQLIASLHVYNFSECSTVSCWNAEVAPVAKAVPIVVGELGQRGCAAGFIDGFMNWADAHDLSYLAWTWDTWNCGSGQALITSYSGNPTAYGSGFKAHLETLLSGSASPA